MTKKKEETPKIKGKDKSKLLIDQIANENIRVPEFNARPKPQPKPVAEEVEEKKPEPTTPVLPTSSLPLVDCFPPPYVVEARQADALRLVKETIGTIIADMIEMLVQTPTVKVFEYTLNNMAEDVRQCIVLSLINKGWNVRLDGSAQTLIIVTPEIDLDAVSVQYATSPPL